MGGIAKIVTCASSVDHPTQRVELLTSDDGNGVATPHVYVTDANSDEYVADFTIASVQEVDQVLSEAGWEL